MLAPVLDANHRFLSRLPSRRQPFQSGMLETSVKRRPRSSSSSCSDHAVGFFAASSGPTAARHGAPTLFQRGVSDHVRGRRLGRPSGHFAWSLTPRLPWSPGLCAGSDSGRHRSPPGRRGRKPTAGNDFSSRLNIARPTRNHPPRKHAGSGWGEHLARGAVPLPVPPRRSSRRAADGRKSPMAHLNGRSRRGRLTPCPLSQIGSAAGRS